MFKLYDTSFKIGFGLTVLGFVILNIINFIIAETEKANSKIDFCPCGFGASWGFPFPMTNHSNYVGLEPLTFALNISICLVCGYVFGLILRFLWKKFGKANNNSQG